MQHRIIFWELKFRDGVKGYTKNVWILVPKMAGKVCFQKKEIYENQIVYDNCESGTLIASS